MSARESTGGRRTLAAHAAIGLGACLMLHAFVAGPIARRAEDRRLEVQRLSAERQQDGTLAALMPRVALALDEQARDAAALEERGSIVKDDAALYGALMDLAHTSGVRVEFVEPITPTRAAGAADARSAPGDRSASYSIRVTGSFAQVSRYLSLLQNSLAFSSVNSFRLTPVGTLEGERIVAAIETSHHYVDTTAEPTSAAAEAGAPEETR
jgi:hypothetical protein